MAESKLLILKDWFESINKTLPVEDAQSIVFAIGYYSCFDKKADLVKEFGQEKATRIAPILDSYYLQMDKINHKFPEGGGRKEKYDSEVIEKLASQGKTVKEICEELHIEYNRSIYSNKGYKAGKAKWDKIKANCGGQDPRTMF